MSRLSHPGPVRFFQSPVFWQLQLIGWVCLLLVTLPLKRVVFGSFGAAFLMSAYQLPLSLALSAGLRLLYRQMHVAQRSFATAAGVVLVACIVAGLVDVAVSAPLNGLLGIADQSGLAEAGMLAFRVAVYLIWSLVYFLVKSLIEARELAFQSAVAEERHRFELLRYQLNPSFLANTLRTIGREIEAHHPTAARAMTERLASFYQQTLRHADHGQTATVGDEVALVRTYLEIEQLRLGDALRVRFDIDEDLLSLHLPPVLLLPLAEQAVREASGSDAQPLEITLTVQRAPDGLILLELADTGRINPARKSAFDPANPDISNVRQALARHFPGQHRFAMTQDSLRVRATLCLPLKN